jgi:hypothetical protein
MPLLSRVSRLDSVFSVVLIGHFNRFDERGLINWQRPNSDFFELLEIKRKERFRLGAIDVSKDEVFDRVFNFKPLDAAFIVLNFKVFFVKLLVNIFIPEARSKVLTVYALKD